MCSPVRTYVVSALIILCNPSNLQPPTSNLLSFSLNQNNASVLKRFGVRWLVVWCVCGVCVCVWCFRCIRALVCPSVRLLCVFTTRYVTNACIHFVTAQFNQLNTLKSFVLPRSSIFKVADCYFADSKLCHLFTPSPFITGCDE